MPAAKDCEMISFMAAVGTLRQRWSGRDGQQLAPSTVAGSGTLNAGDAKVTSVSCRPAGRCAAGGTYTDASGHTQAFVVNQS